MVIKPKESLFFGIVYSIFMCILLYGFAYYAHVKLIECGIRHSLVFNVCAFFMVTKKIAFTIACNEAARVMLKFGCIGYYDA